MKHSRDHRVAFLVPTFGLMCLLSHAAGFGQQVAAQMPALIRLHESILDATSRGNVLRETCGVVSFDGSFYLETRYQGTPGSEITVRVYDGVLGDYQMSALRNMLDTADLKQLADSGPIHPDIASSGVKRITASINRQQSSQNLEYYDWMDHGSHYVGTSDTEIERQKLTLRILSPLLTWFHGLDVRSLKDSNRTASYCRD